jgi:hypothetical protein
MIYAVFPEHKPNSMTAAETVLDELCSPNSASSSANNEKSPKASE